MKDILIILIPSVINFFSEEHKAQIERRRKRQLFNQIIALLIIVTIMAIIVDKYTDGDIKIKYDDVEIDINRRNNPPKSKPKETREDIKKNRKECMGIAQNSYC